MDVFEGGGGRTERFLTPEVDFPSLELLLCTIFIRIIAAANINFSLAGVWLLFEGSFY